MGHQAATVRMRTMGEIAIAADPAPLEPRYSVAASTSAPTWTTAGPSAMYVRPVMLVEVVIGSRVSATIHALSLAVRHRRRPILTITLIWRKPSAYIPLATIGQNSPP